MKAVETELNPGITCDTHGNRRHGGGRYPQPAASRLCQWVAILMLATCLSACSRKEQPAAKPAAVTAAVPSPSTLIDREPAELTHAQEKELMQAIFGADYNPERENALATVQEEGEDTLQLMSMVSAVELPDGRTVTIINGARSDENGADQSGHASAGMLHVYILRRAGTKWTVLERRESIEELGSSGNIGSVKWVMLAPNKPGFIVSSGGTWQGHTIRFADIFDLGHGVRGLGSFKEMSSNEGACTPEKDECWDVDSSLRFVDGKQPGEYRDVLVDFNDKRYKVTEDKDGNFVEHPKGTTKQTARYHFDGKEYVLVSGKNPVPDI